MADQQINQHLALEMTMQDVLGNMEELALDFGFSGGAECFEILAIEPAEPPSPTAAPSSGPRLRSPFSADILELFATRLFRVA
jgi:hypothetical protein